MNVIAKWKLNSFHFMEEKHALFHSPVEKGKEQILARNKVSVLIEQDVAYTFLSTSFYFLSKRDSFL